MKDSSLNPAQRRRALAKMTDDTDLDVLVIGGGATGAGIALDAVTRGLRTGLVEMQDWASGASSRSTGLIHAALSHLSAGRFGQLSDALGERALLTHRIAPHLVRPQAFLSPLSIPLLQRAGAAAGLGVYDALGRIRGGRAPFQRHYDKAGALGIFPDIRPNRLTGAIRFYDSRVDDARLVLTLVRTAVGYGAYAASRTQVVGLIREGEVVVGAEVVDLQSGQRHRIRARQIIAAVGVWTGDIESMGLRSAAGAGAPGGAAPGGGPMQMRITKGVHVVVPRERIRGMTGLFHRARGAHLVAVPWADRWVVGVTEVAYAGPRTHPVATARDIAAVLGRANAILRSELTREDVLASFAGLRPLLPPVGPTNRSTRMSSGHALSHVAPGLTAVVGGSLTTYRLMAQEAVDFAIGAERAAAQPSLTRDLQLRGAVGFQVARNQAGSFRRRMGWDQPRVDRLLERYGADLPVLTDMISEDESLAAPLQGAPQVLRAEIVHAVEREGALHLEDILRNRLRLAYTNADRGLSALDEIGDLVAPLLGWGPDQLNREKDACRATFEAHDAASWAPDEEQASDARARARDIVPRR